jgi:predicted  nucleic acid-binding Zn-ribbon protein
MSSYTTADAAAHLAQHLHERGEQPADLLARYDALKAAVAAQRNREALGLSHSLDALKVQWQALRVELDGERRAAAALQTAIQVAAEAATDLRASLERERARADGAEAELRALRDVGALPWWRRLLPGPR